jgi:hypothetical protein
MTNQQIKILSSNHRHWISDQKSDLHIPSIFALLKIFAACRKRNE